MVGYFGHKYFFVPQTPPFSAGKVLTGHEAIPCDRSSSLLSAVRKFNG